MAGPVTAGLVADFDARDLASLAAWTPVGSPAYQPTGLDGDPCIYLEGASGYISSDPAIVEALSVAHANTVFWVGAPDALDRDEAVLGLGKSAGGSASRAWGKNTTGIGSWSLTTIRDDGTPYVLQTVHRTVPGTQIHCWHASISKVSYELNPGAVGCVNLNSVSHPLTAATCDRVGIGFRPGLADLFFQGKLAQLKIYNRRLTAAEILEESAYLGGRWKLTRLRHVIVQGDSIPNGSSGGTPIASLLNVPGALITNLATGGRKAWQLWGTDIDYEMIQFCATGSVIATIMIGSNDLSTGTGAPGSYSSAEVFLSDHAATIARLRSLPITTVVTSVWYRNPDAPLPGGLYGTWGNNPNFNGDVDEANAAFLVEGDGGRFGDFIENSFADWLAAGGYSLLGPDGIHPTDQGSAVLGLSTQRGVDRAVAALEEQEQEESSVITMGNHNNSTSTGTKLVQYAASAVARNLLTDSPDGKTCARMLKILGAGSFTSALGSQGAAHSTPLGPLGGGDTLPGEFSSVISADAAFIAFY